ncbi:MAG TPA: peptidylprolyl isomerase [Herpetosiphonaceae bacterium]
MLGGRWFWEERYLPSRTVGQVGERTITRRDYLIVLELNLAQFILKTQDKIKAYDQIMQTSQDEKARSFAEQARQQYVKGLDDTLTRYAQLRGGPLRYIVLNQMIEDDLILQGAARDGVTVGDDDVYRTLAAKLLSPPQEEPAIPLTPTLPLSEVGSAAMTPAAARETVVRTLSAAYDELARMLTESYGISPQISREDYIKHTVHHQRVQLLRERIGFDLVPIQEPPPQLQAYAQVMVLTIPRPITATDEFLEAAYARRKVQADVAYAQINQGADFATVGKPYAVEANEDYEPQWIVIDQLFPEQAEALRTQPLGEVGPPVKSTAGWFLFKVLRRELRPDENTVPDMRVAAFHRWLEHQRATLPVRRFPEPTAMPTGLVIPPEDADHGHTAAPTPTPASAR